MVRKTVSVLIWIQIYNFNQKVQFYLELHFGNNGCWVKHKFWFYTVLAWRQSTALALFRLNSCRSCVQSYNKLFLSTGDHAWKMRTSKGRDRADVKSDSKKFFFTQQLRSYISVFYSNFKDRSLALNEFYDSYWI